jgi:type I restriction enzyme R subunit
VPYSESETRQEIIDKRLALAGWNVDDPSQVIQELDIFLERGGRIGERARRHPYEGHRFADYALVHRGAPIAVVEAKKTSKDAQLGQEQAARYARDLHQLNGGAKPFIAYTNGYDIYFWDDELYPPVPVHGFPTPSDLEWLGERRAQRKPLSVEMINTSIIERDYQIAAIRTIAEQIERGRQKFLLVMATGTGKTRTAVALVDLLMRARWVKRVLFLVDRIALQNQALNEGFKPHLPSEPRWPEGWGVPFERNRRIYVTTYPTMLNLIQAGSNPSAWISPFFFDLIIADESHRSIYKVYREVMDYFYGLKLGLTATPRDHVDHDTYRLFDCEVEEPTFLYSYEEAVSHDPPYLCDFEVLKVRSKFQLEGIKGGTLPAHDQLRLIEEGKELDEIDFEGTELEYKVTNSGTNALIVREFMEECIKDPDGALPGKSIIFAVSVAHARRLQDLFDQMYPEHRGRLARVLVSEDRYVHGKGGLLDQFKNEDMPRVAISVDMLDTGVDIREVVNLVFAKPVYSYVKFWQMIGRGTRVLDERVEQRKPWCPEKDKFLIIDCWGNFERFEMEPRGREPGVQVPVAVQLFRARLDKLEAALAADAAPVVASVIGDLRADLAALPETNVVVNEHAADLARVRQDAFWERLSKANLGFLRSRIAPVLRVRANADFKALRFERDVTELGTALLAQNRELAETLKDAVVTQVAELPLGVNVVAAERDLIERVKSAAFWETPTDEMLRVLVTRLGPLMGYRREERPDPMKLDLADLVAIKETIEYGPHKERMSQSAYRQKVEAHVRALVAENPTLQKLQRGEPVTDAEVEELAALLGRQDPYVTEPLLRRIYDNRRASFMAFIRHILGLEPLENWSVEVTKKFDEFIAAHSDYTSLQIRFLQTLRTFILQTRTLEKRHLVELPFTQIHPKGIRGVFSTTEVDEIVEFAGRLVA